MTYVNSRVCFSLGKFQIERMWNSKYYSQFFFTSRTVNKFGCRLRKKKRKEKLRKADYLELILTPLMGVLDNKLRSKK